MKGLFIPGITAKMFKDASVESVAELMVEGKIYDIDYAVEFMEQESVLDKVRAEIDECGSIWVAYAITGRSDRDIENLIKGVLKQAKEQVLNIIDKYRTESEE